MQENLRSGLQNGYYHDSEMEVSGENGDLGVLWDW